MAVRHALVMFIDRTILRHVLHVKPMFAFFAVVGVLWVIGATTYGSSHCVNPVDGLNISSDTVLCEGTFTLTDVADDGIVRILTDNVTLSCENAATTIQSTGDGSTGLGIGMAENLSGVTIQDCTISGFGNDIAVHDASNFTLLNNTLQFTGPTGSEGKGLQYGNDSVVDSVTIRGNTFSGTGNAMSVNASATHTNLLIENNTFSASIDNVNLGGGNNTTSFTLRGNTYTQGGGEVININNASGALIENETIESGVTGNLLLQDAQELTLRDSLIQTGLQLENLDDSTIERNYLDDQISVTQGSSGNVIQNNIIDAELRANWTIRVAGSVSNTIRNNTSYGGRNYGIFLEGTSTNTTVQNNIISEADQELYVDADAQSGFVSDYNVFFDDGGAFAATWGVTSMSSLADWITTTSQDENSSYQDPLFTDGPGADFTHNVSSPAIDAGSPSSALPTDDYTGGGRPYGATGRYDAGAYETSTPVTSGVSMVGVATYDVTDGQTVTLSITDESNNPSGTQYAVTNATTVTWLDGSGGTQAMEFYDASTSWQELGLSGGATYAFDFKTANASETTVTNLSGMTVSVLTLPDAPSALSGNAESPSALELSWSAPSGTVTGYDVSYGVTPSADTTQVTNLSATTTTITGLSAGTTYYVKVRAQNGSGEGPYSETMSLATQDEPVQEPDPEEPEEPEEPEPPLDDALDPPSGLVSDISSQTAELSWSEVAGAVSYIVSYGQTLSANDETLETEALALTLELSAKRNYWWKVKARDADANESIFSETETFRTQFYELVVTPDPLIYSNVRVLETDGTQITQFFAFGLQKLKIKTEVGDFDDDGEYEIAVVPVGPSNAGIHVRFFGLRTGEYKGSFFPFGDSGQSGGADIAVANINEAGGDDLVLVPFSGEPTLRLYRFKNDHQQIVLAGETTHELPEDTIQHFGYQVNTGDYDGDGDSDIAVATRNQRANVQVFMYEDGILQKLGWFLPYAQGVYADVRGSEMVTGDINGDMQDDLIFVAHSTAQKANVQVFTYDASDTVEKAFRVSRGFKSLNGRLIDRDDEEFAGLFRITVGDLDADARDEIVVGSDDGMLRVLAYRNDTLVVIRRLDPFLQSDAAVTPTIVNVRNANGERLFVTNVSDSLIRHFRLGEPDGFVLMWQFYGFDPTARFGSRLW